MSHTDFIWRHKTTPHPWKKLPKSTPKDHSFHRDLSAKHASSFISSLWNLNPPPWILLPLLSAKLKP